MGRNHGEGVGSLGDSAVIIVSSAVGGEGRGVPVEMRAKTWGVVDRTRYPARVKAGVAEAGGLKRQEVCGKCGKIRGFGG